MNLQESSTDFWTDFLEKIGRAWWIEIITQTPSCIYYFGPFMNAKAALFAQSAYIEDLEREASQIITINIKRCQPQELTIFEDEEDELVKDMTASEQEKSTSVDIHSVSTSARSGNSG